MWGGEGEWGDESTRGMGERRGGVRNKRVARGEGGSGKEGIGKRVSGEKVGRRGEEWGGAC